MLETLTIEGGGRVTLPDAVLTRYGFAPDTPVRLIETQNGVLLIPLTNEPMNEALQLELAAWQALGAESLESITLTITEDERAELEVLLDAYLAEVRKDKGEHERVMARVDENLREARRNLALLHADLEAPYVEKVP